MIYRMQIFIIVNKSVCLLKICIRREIDLFYKNVRVCNKCVKNILFTLHK